MESHQLRENLAKIEQASNNIVSLSDLAFKEKDHVTYIVKSGTCTGIGLWHDKKSAVQYAVIGPETVLQNHRHDETEILILVKGDFRLRFDTHNLHAIQGVPITILPNTPHTAISDTGCEIIAITIPASEAYPNSKDNGSGT
jgi:quercetin dioxygenase-like cupin family protein